MICEIKEEYTMEDKMECIAQTVFDRLMDHFIDENILRAVEPVFVPGHPCYEEYVRMREAYGRICRKLGCEEDPDCEIMIDALLRQGNLLALEMFRYGAIYGAEQKR